MNIDERSPVWKAIEGYCQERMDKAKANLESPTNSRDEDLYYKGLLAAYRDIASLSKKEESQVRPEFTYI